MERYISYIIQSTENRVTYFLKKQIKGESNPYCGMLKGDLIEVKPTIYAMTEAISIYLNPESKFYHEVKIKIALERAIKFVEQMQGEDGLFDFPSCNFQSAPDTAFCFKRMIAAHRLIELWDREGFLLSLKDHYLRIMYRAVLGIKKGGFHTPNHRWAIAAALLQGYELFRNKETCEESIHLLEQEDGLKMMKATAWLYLKEGIDCSSDGEYSEHSSGNYNAVVNASMMALYESTGDMKYLNCILKNLEMMLTMIDGDDRIFTSQSTRQDKGTSIYATKYFYQYLYAATLSENKIYERAAHKIIMDAMGRGDEAPNCLYVLMQNPGMYHYNLKEYGFLESYRRYLIGSGMLRVKTTRYTCSIIKSSSPFLYFKVGSSLFTIRIGESYCDVRSFLPEKLVISEQSCSLENTVKGWYYLPFREPQETSDWWEMDQTKREKIYTDELKISVDVKEMDHGIELSLRADGLERLPLRVEIGLPKDSRLEYEKASVIRKNRKQTIIKEGTLDIFHEERQIRIGEGFAEHTFLGHYSETVDEKGSTLYFNCYTPCEKSISLTIVK